MDVPEAQRKTTVGRQQDTTMSNNKYRVGHKYHQSHYNYHRSKLYDTTKNDSFDMEELRQRIRLEQMKSMSNIIDQLQPQQHEQQPKQQQQQHQLPIKNLHSQPTQHREPIDTVYIVTFPKRQSARNVCEAHERTSTTSSLYDGGGVHSIEYPIGSGKNVVLAFTDQLACDKFVQSLREQQFFHPMTQKVSIEVLVDFCINIGVMIQLVPDGIDVVPPKQNVSKFGLRQQQQDTNSISNNNNSQHSRQQQQQQEQEQQRTKEKLNFLYYMLDETDDFDDEGILFDDYYSTNTDNTSFGVFD